VIGWRYSHRREETRMNEPNGLCAVKKSVRYRPVKVSIRDDGFVARAPVFHSPIGSFRLVRIDAAACRSGFPA
jgi:hypothetical protein